MRIGIDIRSLHEKHPSGVSFFAQYAIQSLLRLYPQHEFVLFYNSASEQLSLPLQTNSRVRIVTRRIPNKFLHLSFSFFGRPSLERLMGPCDVYYFPNVHYFPTIPVRSVLTIHDISYIQTPDLYAWKNSVWYRLTRARSRIRQFSRIIADSHATAHALRDSFPELHDRISIVHPAPLPLHNVTLQEPEHFLLLGDVDERKNIEGALRAFAAVRNEGRTTLPLVIAGKRGYGSLQKHTRKLLRSLTDKGWVIEKGYVSDALKQQLLASARALLFVSHYEGFGFPGLEAEQLSLPIIASQRTSLPEVLGEGPIYVDPRNWESIADALRIVMSSNFPRQILYQNALLDRTWDDVARDMMSIFISLK